MSSQAQIPPHELEGYRKADELMELIRKRTGLSANDLECPRERSEMTPCIARDGKLAVCFNTREHPICVGCETSVERQLEEEKKKHV